MSIAGTFRAGKGSAIQANGVFLTHNKFDGEETADKIPTENFESSARQGLTALPGCRFNCGGLFDAHKNPYDSPPGIFVQDEFPNLYLYTNFLDGVFFLFPLSLILSNKVGMPVREGVSFDWSGESNGTYSRPTGSV